MIASAFSDLDHNPPPRAFFLGYKHTIVRAMGQKTSKTMNLDPRYRSSFKLLPCWSNTNSTCSVTFRIFSLYGVPQSRVSSDIHGSYTYIYCTILHYAYISPPLVNTPDCLHSVGIEDGLILTQLFIPLPWIVHHPPPPIFILIHRQPYLTLYRSYMTWSRLSSFISIFER